MATVGTTLMNEKWSLWQTQIQEHTAIFEG
jgi:hypothetical protein